MIRKDHSDMIYRTLPEKWDAVVEEIKERYEHGQPVQDAAVALGAGLAVQLDGFFGPGKVTELFAELLPAIRTLHDGNRYFSAYISRFFPGDGLGSQPAFS